MREVYTNSVMDTNKRRRRHRSWPEALKRESVAAMLAPGSSVSVVARRYDVNANQVFAWRRRYSSGSGRTGRAAVMPVTVTPDQIEAAQRRASELVDIELVSGYRVRVGSGVKESTLRLVLRVLERR